MGEPFSGDKHPKTKLTIETPQALAGIGYNAITAADRATSDEDEAAEVQEILPDDARSAIQVSINREQARLTSPKTPAVEKAAAIENAGGFFPRGDPTVEATLVEEAEESDDDEKEGIQEDSAATLIRARDTTLSQPPKSELPDRSPRRTSVRLPSPWRAESSAQWQRSEKAKSGLLDGLIFNRRRAASGTESGNEGWQKWLLSSLPSFPRPFSLSSPFPSSNDAKVSFTSGTRGSSKGASVDAQNNAGVVDSNAGAVAARLRSRSDGQSSILQTGVDGEMQEEPKPLPNLQSLPLRRPTTARGPLLRRSTSDQSLLTQRTLSIVESLGDDTRFEHVQDQVNSRLKAIRDSWQDSSIKLPSFPSFNVSNFAPDFMRDRSGSLNKRQGSRAINTTTINAKTDVNTMNESRNMPDRQRGGSTSPAIDGGPDHTLDKTSSHPHFNRALEQLEGDVLVLGGYRGSILRSAEPPYRQLWVPVKVGLNLRKANLEVGLEATDDERAVETIIPGGMLTHIGPVDIARRLLKRLRNCRNAQSGRLRIHDYGYDWRLNPDYLSKQLIQFLETLPCNQTDVPKERRGVTVIAHSLGGLITRHAVNQRPELFRGIVNAGVPTTCVNILGPMRNGDDVLLSNRVLTAQVNFTIRTSFVLLPLDGRCFFDKATGEEYPVDFFDPNTWIDLRLSPCVGRPLPPLNVQAKRVGITGYVSSMTSALPSLPLPGRRASLRSQNPSAPSKAVMAGGVAEPDMVSSNTGGSQQAVDSGNIESHDYAPPNSVNTTVTIPREAAVEYLTRTLASIKKFKQELAFNPDHAAANVYPPISVIYGKSTPTVYGAKVDGREGIKHADAYDQLAFASGDGVVLARAAMMPQGYKTARGGVVCSERGHVTLLSDLEAVGKCLNAVMRARKKGVGLGT